MRINDGLFRAVVVRPEAAIVRTERISVERDMPLPPAGRISFGREGARWPISSSPLDLRAVILALVEVAPI